MALFDEIPFLYGKGYDYGTMFAILNLMGSSFFILILFIFQFLL
jgi:hypothetical protein